MQNVTYQTSSEDAFSSFELLGYQFGQFHQDPTNVFLHFVTTPFGLLGAVGLIRYATKSSSSLVALGSLYLLTLLPIVPNGVFVGTTILCGIIVLLASKLELNIIASIAFIAIGYLLQDLAHIGTGEKTFQESYTQNGRHVDFSFTWLHTFVEHTYYLLPLCVHVALPGLKVPDDMRKILDSPLPVQLQQLHTFGWLLAPLVFFFLGSYCLDSKNSFCFFPGAPYFYRILQCNIVTGEGESRKVDLQSIRAWVMSFNPPETKSSHWWFRELEGDIRNAFDRCAKATQIFKMFRSLFSERHYCVDIIEGMNEIYVTGPTRLDETSNSDQVFYTRHVDGPWGFIPFVSVYRCLIGMDKNYMIETHFPLANVSTNILEGDALAFDFNREVHYITRDEDKKSISDDFRVTLKLHYCVYPRILAPLGWLMKFLNVRYNMLFRALFLKTINPVSMYEHFLAWNVTANTVFYNSLETYFGIRNMIYLAFAGSLWWATDSYTSFFVLTSFVHYVRYISTYYIRRGIDFGSFKRDVLLFKTLALVQLFYHYFFPSTRPFEFDPVSAAMIATGYVVSMMATNALGVDRTYFAAELGLVEPKWITQFPYGYIPHPMIVSQVFALLGFFKAAHFRAEWPYLVPVHVAFYVTHMLQEHFDIYKRYPDAATAAVAAAAPGLAAKAGKAE